MLYPESRAVKPNIVALRVVLKVVLLIAVPFAILVVFVVVV